MLASLDLFAAGTAPGLALLGARVGGLVLIAPTLAARTVPTKLKIGLIALFTLLLAPAAVSVTGVVPSITPATMLSETIVGFAIGLGAAVIIGAAEAAGETMAIQIGLSGASIFDPVNNMTVPALGGFMQTVAITMLLTFDLHLVMLDALATSTRVAPLGAPLAIADGLWAMVGTTTTLFALGLQLAAPVMTVILVANVSLAVLSRAAPQLNVLGLAFPLQIGVGLLTLFAALPYMAAAFPGWTGIYDMLLDRMMSALMGGG